MTPTPAWSISRAPFLAASAFLLALHALFAWLGRAPSITTGGDDGEFLVLARSLHRLRYANLELIGAPPHAKFPPLYPTFLALIGATDLRGIPLAIAANVALSVVALALATAVAARWSRGIALTTLLGCALAPMLITLASGVYSEPLFLALTFAALWLLTAPTATGRARAGAGAALIGASLVRSAGVAFLLALFVHWALERRWRALAMLGLASALTVGAWGVWMLRNATRFAGNSYVADLVFDAQSSSAAPTNGVARGDSVGAPLAAWSSSPVLRAARIVGNRLVRNVPTYAAETLPQGLGVPTVAGTRVDNALWLLLLVGAGGVGAWVAWRSRRVVALFVAAYGALLVAWPYALTRFLAPLLPLTVLLLVLGAREIVSRLIRRRRESEASFASDRAAMAAAMAAALLVALVVGAGALAVDAQRLRLIAQCDRAAPLVSPGCFSEEQRDYFAAAIASRTLLPDSAIVIVSKAPAFHLLTGRHAVRLAEAAAQPPASLPRYLRARHVDYLLLSRVHLDQWSLADGLRPICHDLALVGRYGAHVALVRTSPPVPPESDACDAMDAWRARPWSDTPALIW